MSANAPHSELPIGVMSDTVDPLWRNPEPLWLAIESAEIGIWYWDLKVDRLVWTDRCNALFGLPPGSTVSYPLFLELLHPDDRAPTDDIVRQAMEKRVGYAAMYRVILPGGRIRWLRALGQVNHDAEGNVLRMQGTVQDITEQREAEIRLNEVLIEKDALLVQKNMLFQEVNHRIKNSLQLVISLLELQRANLVATAQQNLFDEALGRLNAISAIHNRLNQLQVVQHVAFDGFLKDFCRDFATASSAHEQLRYTLAIEVILLETNQAVALALIVNELLTNARKYGRTKGEDFVEIKLSLERNGEDAILTFADCGTGWPAELIANNLSAGKKGSLGMTIIRALSGQLHGSPEFTDNQPGARFRLQFHIDPAGIETMDRFAAAGDEPDPSI